MFCVCVCFGKQELDHSFDRALGLRISNELNGFLTFSSPLVDQMRTSQQEGGVMQLAMPKMDARKMWSKNMKRRRRNANKTQAGAAAAAATKNGELLETASKMLGEEEAGVNKKSRQQQQQMQLVQEQQNDDADEMEEGEFVDDALLEDE